MNMHLVLTLFIVVAVCACVKDVRLDRPAPDPQNCKSACLNIGVKGLNCPEGQDLWDGNVKHTCEDDCTEMQKSGHSMKAACMTKVKTCAEIHTKCGQ